MSDVKLLLLQRNTWNLLTVRKINEHVLYKSVINKMFTNYIFGLVSLFNGISTFVGYLMPNLFKKNSSGTI